jgi:hypothetical protein
MLSANVMFVKDQNANQLRSQLHIDFISLLKSIGISIVNIEAINPTIGQTYRVTNGSNPEDI